MSHCAKDIFINHGVLSFSQEYRICENGQNFTYIIVLQTGADYHIKMGFIKGSLPFLRERFRDKTAVFRQPGQVQKLYSNKLVNTLLTNLLSERILRNINQYLNRRSRVVSPVLNAKRAADGGNAVRMTGTNGLVRAGRKGIADPPVMPDGSSARYPGSGYHAVSV
jgi:hypothetical protein